MCAFPLKQSWTKPITLKIITSRRGIFNNHHKNLQYTQDCVLFVYMSKLWYPPALKTMLKENCCSIQIDFRIARLSNFLFSWVKENYRYYCHDFFWQHIYFSPKINRLTNEKKMNKKIIILKKSLVRRLRE